MRRIWTGIQVADPVSSSESQPIIMRNLYESQESIAEQLTSSSEKFYYLCSILRSLLKVAAVTALEIIREQTPDAVDNSALGAFAKRFNQPTDGLPVAILEVATPVIPSYVSRKYHWGWFERDSKLALEEEPMNAALRDRFAWFLLNRCQRPNNAREFAEQAVKLDPHNADASLTLALCWYRHGELAKGDDEIEAARKKGKPQALCLLRMGIARYHAVKKSPYGKDASELLKQGVFFISEAIRTMDPCDRFVSKNMLGSPQVREAIPRASIFNQIAADNGTIAAA